MLNSIIERPVNGLVITKNFINDCALLNDSEFRHLVTALQAFASKGIVSKKENATPVYDRVFETYINKLYANKVKLSFKDAKPVDEYTVERIVLATSWWPEEAYECEDDDELEDLDKDELGLWLSDIEGFLGSLSNYSNITLSAEAYLEAIKAYRDVYEEFGWEYYEEFYDECVEKLEDILQIEDILLNCREHYTTEQINDFLRTIDFE